jgi:uncharacterized metal-binding protein YceD (DUF177 family)
MALQINLVHLEHHVLDLRGELTIAELDLDPRDDMIRFVQPLRYELQAERLGGAIIVQGRLELTIHCTCVRCLTAFDQVIPLHGWACHLPLEGEERVTVTSDTVDLTPYVREDILLALPQHPLCKAECRGLPSVPQMEVPDSGGGHLSGSDLSVWAELDKLKL